MANSKLIIGLVGEKFAGKDAVANFLVKKYSAEHFRFSHALDEILNILNLPISRRNEIDLGLGLRKIFGEHILVNVLKKRLEGAQSNFIVVNGIRMDEFEVVGSWPNASIIYITAPAEVRFSRYGQRHEKTDDAVMDFQKFLEQEKEATEVGIPKLGKKADFRIENTGSLEELYEKVEEIILKIRKNSS